VSSKQKRNKIVETIEGKRAKRNNNGVEEDGTTSDEIDQGNENEKDTNNTSPRTNKSEENESEVQGRERSLLDMAADMRRKQANMDKRSLKQQQQKDHELLLLKEANQVLGLGRGLGLTNYVRVKAKASVRMKDC
jgi:hypothetical protein